MKNRGRMHGTLFVVCLVGLSVAFWGCAEMKARLGGSPPAPPPQSPAEAPGPGHPAPQAPGPQKGPSPQPDTRWSPGSPRQAPSPAGGATAPGQAPGGETKHFVHVVKYWGESVSIIAGWYTGDIKNWEALAAANPDINPNRIVQGNRIRIPENLMIKHDPMPKEFVDSFYPKGPGKAKPSAPATPAEEEEPALFGPKK